MHTGRKLLVAETFGLLSRNPNLHEMFRSSFLQPMPANTGESRRHGTHSHVCGLSPRRCRASCLKMHNARSCTSYANPCMHASQQTWSCVQGWGHIPHAAPGREREGLHLPMAALQETICLWHSQCEACSACCTPVRMSCHSLQPSPISLRSCCWLHEVGPAQSGSQPFCWVTCSGILGHTKHFL